MQSSKNKINGPINLVRIEGVIDGINKVVYLFMDYHADINEQTNCEDQNNSINISKYLLDNLTTSNDNNVVYDFFLEILPSEIFTNFNTTIFSILKDNELEYLASVKKLFLQNVETDNSNNKITSKLKNVRLHYIDIRDKMYLLMYDPIRFAISSINQLQKNPDDKLLDIMHIIIGRCIEIVVNFMKRIRDVLSHENSNNTNYSDTNDTDYNDNYKLEKQYYEIDYEKFLLDSDIQEKYTKHIEYMLNKLLNKYKNKFVKKIIYDNLITNIINDFSDIIIDLSNQLDYVKQLTNKDFANKQIIDNMLIFLVKYEKILHSVLARFVDIYIMRRLLDKKYVTNAVVYTGAYHSVIYIYLLSKIGFQMTHIVKSMVQSVAVANIVLNDIDDVSYRRNIYNLMYFFENNPFSQQCIDVSKFPKSFL
ncbi:hypothetical protein qu_138 [Acanthamoeba polyphaga mimivirus]|nr:hypothetical protein [Mimivirus reunion]WMV61476.1 hypothetical protein qu_138 [Mimivirus sp.]WMV62453.1 hypothetical protein qu_138 [Acanthamoeba polyphaga mimivirus]WMV63430.1 hypothetical protein qu_138 [Mimivirus sp.]